MRMLLFFSDGEPVLLAAAGTSAGTVSYWAVGAGVGGVGIQKAGRILISGGKSYWPWG